LTRSLIRSDVLGCQSLNGTYKVRLKTGVLASALSGLFSSAPRRPLHPSQLQLSSGPVLLKSPQNKISFLKAILRSFPRVTRSCQSLRRRAPCTREARHPDALCRDHKSQDDPTLKYRNNLILQQTWDGAACRALDLGYNAEASVIRLVEQRPVSSVGFQAFWSVYREHLASARIRPVDGMMPDAADNW
jgi:hypothetical protein